MHSCISHSHLTLIHRRCFKHEHLISLYLCEQAPPKAEEWKTEVIHYQSKLAFSSCDERNAVDFHAIYCFFCIFEPAIAWVEFTLWVIWNACNYSYFVAALHPLEGHVVYPKLLRIEVLANYQYMFFQIYLSLVETAYSFCWDADDFASSLRVFDNARAGPDVGLVSDCLALYDLGAGANFDEVAKCASSGNVGVRVEGVEISKCAVVGHGTVEVDKVLVADFYINCKDSACADNIALSHFNTI